MEWLFSFNLVAVCDKVNGRENIFLGSGQISRLRVGYIVRSRFEKSLGCFGAVDKVRFQKHFVKLYNRNNIKLPPGGMWHA